jgi:crotonobetainyl-CoA:carnitine CoA-transferase CaiB-like acyl-CoA transferase
MSATDSPLAGIKVLDLSRVLAGPVCCQVLADLGADVVKVERPKSGDDTRAWGPPFLEPAGGTANQPGPSAYYLAANRGKRSLALDLARAESRQVLDDLLRAADVMVENFLPHSLDKLGLAPARLARINPRLVRVSISGYGRTGPLADTPGYDLVVQATAGIMSITGEPAGMPMKVGVAITDVITGLYAAISALAGLVRRGGTNAGSAFDLALADCTLASLVNVAEGALLTGHRPERFGNAHPHIVPYEAFATSDSHLVLAVGNDRQWQKFCAAVGKDDWARNPRFATNPERVRNRHELIPLLARLFAERTLAEWLRLLQDAEVPHAPVLALDEILALPQVAARGMIVETRDAAGRRIPLIAGPIRELGREPPPPRVPPALGEHSDEILRGWLGYEAARIAALRHAGAVA